MKPQIRRLSSKEWERWCADSDDLPITCDPAWASAASEVGTWQPALPFHVSDSSGEALAVAYPQTSRFIRPVTLSPFGLGAAFHAKSAEPDSSQLLSAFISSQSLHWRSIGFVLRPFPGRSEVDLPPPDTKRSETTHMLQLDGTFDDLFTGKFRGETRTAIRRADSAGVKVERRSDKEAVDAYYRVHSDLAQTKGGYGYLYPKSLFVSLLENCRRASLLVATEGDRVIGGGIFLTDARQVLYWHGATDRNAAAMNPAYAVLATAIKSAISLKSSWFNFGGSNGLESLVRFKERWGARAAEQTSYSYLNPAVRALKRVARRSIRV
ncbi:MAG TPA: GNAT family N-acetyltransferase [Gemmatimonadaceae bacterium]|nr:GNAT family N-acetyltransferase [Gemmatimonadaceae bacterium]